MWNWLRSLFAKDETENQDEIELDIIIPIDSLQIVIDMMPMQQIQPITFTAPNIDIPTLPLTLKPSDISTIVTPQTVLRVPSYPQFFAEQFNYQTYDFNTKPDFRPSRHQQNSSHIEIEDYIAEKPVYKSAMLKRDLENNDDKPILITLSRQVDGAVQTINLVGGVHIMQSNWIEQIPSDLFRNSYCLAFEIDIPEYYDQRQLHSLAKDFYDMNIDESAVLYGFEDEIKKRFTSLHEGLDPIVIGLENRQQIAEHFNCLGKLDLHLNPEVLFEFAIRAYGLKSVNLYRDDIMVKSLLSKIETHPTFLAAVGKMHLPQMTQMLIEKGFSVTNEEIFDKQAEEKLDDVNLKKPLTL